MIYQAAAAFVVSLIVALAAGRPLIDLLRKLKARQVVSTDAPQRHQAKTGTPTMGGVLILLGAGVGILGFAGWGGPHVGVALCFLASGLIGLADDLLIITRGKSLGLRAREKMAAQAVVAILFLVWFHTAARPIAAESHLPFLPPSDHPLQFWLLALLHLGLIVGFSNAVNLTDGLDGLAAGVTLPCWLCLALLAGVLPLAEGAMDLDAGTGILCAAIAGATCGYLWYNAHPAQVFMGDTGSLAIGGGLAAAAIVLHLEWLLLLIAVVPLIEALSVMAQVVSFKTTGRRIFRMSPIHHHFELVGWAETHVVARFVIVSTGCAALAAAIALLR